jgi:hypothetical protein
VRARPLYITLYFARWNKLGELVKFIEIVLPALKTELHDYDSDGKCGKGNEVGMEIVVFSEEA